MAATVTLGKSTDSPVTFYTGLEMSPK
jgi:hypothetical protein